MLQAGMCKGLLCSTAIPPSSATMVRLWTGPAFDVLLNQTKVLSFQLTQTGVGETLGQVPLSHNPTQVIV